MVFSHKRPRECLPQGRTKVDLLDLSPVCLAGLFFQGSLELLVGKAHGPTVGVVDNGDLVKLHQRVKDKDISESMADISSGIPVYNNFFIVVVS
jgi:hypothetical protein